MNRPLLKEPKTGESEADMASLFPRTILVGARKIYYGEGAPQVMQMIQMGTSPAAGVAMAASTVLQTVGEALNAEGKPTPPDLLMNPDGPAAQGVIEDLSELASAEMGTGPVGALQAEATALYAQQLEEGSGVAGQPPGGPTGAPSGSQGAPQGLLGQASRAPEPPAAMGQPPMMGA